MKLNTLVTHDAGRPRPPVRANGIARYAALLDALECLLTTREAEEFGLRELAKAADAPVASVYHFFPSKSAALVALAERHMEKFVELLEEPFDIESLSLWEDVFVMESERARAYYNSHPVAMKLIFGPAQSWSIRQMDLQNNRQLAEFALQSCRKYFVVPSTELLLERFEFAITMIDSIWALSYARHGVITDDFAREAQRAAVAYLRGYLPPFASKRASDA